jgi:aarF domain-containing kinase
MPDGRLALIDYGQTRRLSDKERLSLAKVVVAIGTLADPSIIADSMQAAGFVARDNSDNEMWIKYATLFFDSDLESQRLGFMTPQLYFVDLMNRNPLIEIPDAFGKCYSSVVRVLVSSFSQKNPFHTCLLFPVFVARVSFLFRGMHAGIGVHPVGTCTYWLREAQTALGQNCAQRLISAMHPVPFKRGRA